MLTSFFTPEQRKEDELEVHLLHHYHNQLQAHGVNDYSWDELMTDYRVKVIWRIFHSVWDCVTMAPPSRQDGRKLTGTDKGYWWPKMQCEVGAYEDLKCADLLDEISLQHH